MPSLLGDRAAQWLRERMDSGDWRTVPRRLNKAGGSDGGETCCLATVSAYTYPTGAFRAVIREEDGRTREVTVLCPNMGGLTRLAEGDVIVLHRCQIEEAEGEEEEET